MRAYLKYFIVFLVLISVNGCRQEWNNTDFQRFDDEEQSITIIKGEPIIWTNESNEFNVYIEAKDNNYLFTLKTRSNIDISKFPEFDAVIYYKHSFVLQTSNDISYYFACKNNEEKQARNQLSYICPKIKKSFYTNIYSYHIWRKDEKESVTLGRLKAAKKVDDVFGE